MIIFLVRVARLKIFQTLLLLQNSYLQEAPEQEQMEPSKPFQQLQHNPLDMSSIADDSNEQSDASSQLDIQEMGLDPLQDQQSFKDNVRQLLKTEGLDGSCSRKSKEEERQNCDHSNEFQGEPFKGSFLREMEILGKTMSFQSTCHNIYEECYENDQILSSLADQTANNSISMLKLVFAKRNIQKNTAELQNKYVIDFCGPNKNKKPSSKCKNHGKKQKEIKKVLTDAQNSTKSMSNYLDRPYSQKKLPKKRTNNKSSRRSPKHNQQQHRKSNLSGNYGKMIKRSNSSLRKVGYSSLNSQIMKNKTATSSLMPDRQLKRRKIQQRLNLKKI